MRAVQRELMSLSKRVKKGPRALPAAMAADAQASVNTTTATATGSPRSPLEPLINMLRAWAAEEHKLELDSQEVSARSDQPLTEQEVTPPPCGCTLKNNLKPN